MTADSRSTLIVALAAVLVTAVLAAVGWNRVRWAGRTALVLAAVLSVVAAVAVQLNRMTEAYPSPPASDPPPALATGSRMLTVTVPGRRSKLTLTMYVYLPAAYRTGQAFRPNRGLVDLNDR